MRTGRLRRRPSLALWVMRALVLCMLVWQGTLMEVVVEHDASAQCSDDDGRRCDCPPNCHCCLACAHHGVAGLPGVDVAEPSLTLLDFVELPDRRAEPPYDSLDRGPPAKIPKPLA